MALPPDPENMNDARADWAEAAVAAFMAATGTDREDALSDLLCDLRHLCDRDDSLGNFEDEYSRSMRSYMEEIAAPGTLYAGRT